MGSVTVMKIWLSIFKILISRPLAVRESLRRKPKPLLNCNVIFFINQSCFTLLGTVADEAAASFEEQIKSLR
jgi:hypothetical protein